MAGTGEAWMPEPTRTNAAASPRMDECRGSQDGESDEVMDDRERRVQGGTNAAEVMDDRERPMSSVFGYGWFADRFSGEEFA